MHMGIITTSIDDYVEENWRSFVKRTYGKGKGVLSQATMDAYKKLMEENEQERLRRRALERLEKGFRMGKILYKTRAELYDRD